MHKKCTHHHVGCLMCLLCRDVCDSATPRLLSLLDHLLVRWVTTTLPASSIRTRGCSSLLGADVREVALLMTEEASDVRKVAEATRR